MKDERVSYAGGSIQEDKGPPLSKLLLAIYFGAFIWGLWALIAYWDGSSGLLDRGGWKELQEKARTQRAQQVQELQ